MAFVLGLAAVIEAIVFWSAGFACERAGPERLRPYALPLYHATVALTLLGIVLADRSAATMALAAVAFLLTVKSLPRIEWLYAALSSLAAACYFRWVSSMGSFGVMASLTAAAFGLWAVGFVVQKFRTELSYRLGLRPFAYESPLFHSSIAAASIAVVIRASIELAGSCALDGIRVVSARDVIARPLDAQGVSADGVGSRQPGIPGLRRRLGGRSLVVIARRGRAGRVGAGAGTLRARTSGPAPRRDDRRMAEHGGFGPTLSRHRPRLVRRDPGRGGGHGHGHGPVGDGGGPWG